MYFIDLDAADGLNRPNYSYIYTLIHMEHITCKTRRFYVFLIKKNGISEDFDCKIGSKCAETSNCCNNCGQFPHGGLFLEIIKKN